MSEKHSEKIKLWGIVQGVGFRPFVAKLAKDMGLMGEVLNTGGLVDIVLTDTAERIDEFIKRLKAEKPLPAEIVHIKRQEVPFRAFSGFTILSSSEGDGDAAMIPPDLSICDSCLDELKKPDNERYMHPFISCMICGPRYTIMDRIPYDRDTTAMIDWPMCDFCGGQYTDISARRFHAQTISCHDCGPVLLCRLSDAEENAARETRKNERSISEESAENALCGKWQEELTLFQTDFLSREEKARALEWAFGKATDENTEYQHFADLCGCEDYEFPLEKKKKIIRQVLEPIAVSGKLILEGKVIELKGVGGYNLVCDPASLSAIEKLRTVKAREQKPFAVMFKNIEQIKKYSYVGSAEEKLLKSSAKPILLLEHKPAAELAKVVKGSTAEFERSRFTGSFLPSAAFQYMLIDFCERPLVVTSSNISDMPIIKDDAQALSFMEENPKLISACLYNERDIRLRVDDSVVRVIDSQPQIIRRSKGYAPLPLYLNTDKEKMIFAAGGQLKNSFALSKGALVYVSQYFGDMDSALNQKIYAENVERMCGFFKVQPQAAVCDLHPAYDTTAYAEKFSKARDIPLFKVQHHHAHIASVMAEHNIDDKIIGVSMDGTGYGSDGAVWGGEFFVCDGGKAERKTHVKYVEMLGGDSSMKDAYKSACCYSYAFENGYFDEELTENFSIALKRIYDYSIKNGTLRDSERFADYGVIRAALENKINSIKSSSMGRLFDAVCALLGIKDYNDYEGQCAIMLEDAAERARKTPNAAECDKLALEFHIAAAEMICKTCIDIRSGAFDGALPTGESDVSKPLGFCIVDGRGVNKVALSGGVFQNKILTEECLRLLRKNGFEVFYNVSVSPNDGGIAAGQTYVALKYLEKQNIV